MSKSWVTIAIKLVKRCVGFKFSFFFNKKVSTTVIFDVIILRFSLIIYFMLALKFKPVQSTK